MPFVKKRIKKTGDNLLNLSQVKLFDIENVQMSPSDYKKNDTPPSNNWSHDTVMNGAHKHYWLRAEFDTPSIDGNERLLLIANSGQTGWDATNPQGLVYLNGKVAQGIDVNHREVYLEADTHYEMYIYFYTGDVQSLFQVALSVVKEYKNVLGLYYDILTPYEALEVLNENTSEYSAILSALECACNCIDLREPYSGEFFKSIDTARDYLENAFYSTLCTTKGKPLAHCIGHTHIDVEWLWTRAQTREKIQRSFATAKTLMDKYPEYKFTLSQPELYRYLKEDEPEEYEALKELVKQGRWEPEGALWVECDCNLVSGESFVRQLLHGKSFFKEEFGTDSKVLFLPDVFGYSAALPQILKKSGVEYFVTSKISWNDTNLLPYDSFMWQGIDGTEIYSSFITSQVGQKNHNYNTYTTYVGQIDSPFVIGCWDRYQQKEYNSNVLLTFGFGDGGGGPTREMLEKYLRLCRGIPGLPAAKMNFILPALNEAKTEFDRNCQKLGRTPRWVGELYLEFHRGTYTSIAKNKRHNRKAEFVLSKAEALSYIDLLNGGSYDSSGLYSAWRKVLHNQFHDILPGSSIHEVYEGTDKDYETIAEYCNEVINQKLSNIVDNIHTGGGILVYNPLGFGYSPILKVEGKTVEALEEVGSFGWKVIKEYISDSAVTIDGLTAENELYRLRLDQSGAIISLYDKKACRETIKAGEMANRFVAFEDEPYDYDAWEISNYYKAKPYRLDGKANITPVFDGSRAGFQVVKKYMDSTIVQNIWLYSEGKRIDFETNIDWHQKHQLLKIFFPIDVYTDKATYEIQFGHVTRPTHQNTSWDSARFEVCAHKWVDISENGYGVSLINDCKYGFSAEGTTLSLTALKSASFPNPHADEGNHTFTYSLIPHNGSLYDAGIIKESYKLNQSAEAIPIAAKIGCLPEQFSLVSTDTERVVIETVKRAESDDSMVVRMYESFGGKCTATITVPEVFHSACLCDLMENEQTPLEIKDGKVTLEFGAFEITTIKLKKE